MAWFDTPSPVSCDNPVWIGDPYYAPAECPQDIEGASIFWCNAGATDKVLSQDDGIDFIHD